MTNPWQLTALARAEVCIADDPSEWPQFCHVSTAFQDTEGGDLSAGTVVFGTVDESSDRILIGFEWIEIERGVVALADPMTVVSNLRLTNESGPSRIVQLNRVIREIPWRQRVCEQLEKARGPRETRVPCEVQSLPRRGARVVYAAAA